MLDKSQIGEYDRRGNFRLDEQGHPILPALDVVGNSAHPWQVRINLGDNKFVCLPLGYEPTDREVDDWYHDAKGA